MTGDITTDTLDFKRLTREHYEEVCIYHIANGLYTLNTCLQVWRQFVIDSSSLHCLEFLAGLSKKSTELKAEGDC